MCNEIEMDARADILADVRAGVRGKGSAKPPRCNDTTPDERKAV